jgi:hypothetical protein
MIVQGSFGLQNVWYESAVHSAALLPGIEELTDIFNGVA